jgi:hypothetical protein
MRDVRDVRGRLEVPISHGRDPPRSRFGDTPEVPHELRADLKLLGVPGAVKSKRA